MNINELKAFVSAAEWQSLSQAAQTLNLTQPAVSKRISVLESRIGTQLFERLGRRVSLTQAGKTLLPRARKVIADLSDMLTEIQNISNNVSGKISIAINKIASDEKSQKLLNAFQEHNQNVDLNFDCLAPQEAFAALLSGKIDAALSTLPGEAVPGLSEYVLFEERLYVVIAKNKYTKYSQSNHSQSLAKNDFNSTLSAHCAQDINGAGNENLADNVNVDVAKGCSGVLSDLPYISLDTIAPSSLVQEFCRDSSIEFSNGLQTNDFESMKLMISLGQGWGLLPENCIDDRCQIIDTGDHNFTHKFGLIINDTRVMTQAIQALVALAK